MKEFERFTDKYSDWVSTLNQDTRFKLHFSAEELQDHLSSKRVKDECEYLGITLDQYKRKFIIKAEEE
jgi:hypothetical protein